MNDNEQRAHDIAVKLLPKLIEKEEIEYYYIDKNGRRVFNSFDIIDLYDNVYEALLMDLQEL